MSKQVEAATSLLLVVAICVTMLAGPGLAQLPPLPQIPGLPNIPGLGLIPGLGPLPGLPGQLPGGPQDIAKCWSSLSKIPGCVLEIYGSLFNAQLGSVGPACCNSFVTISDTCGPRMFPLNPVFPPLLKDICIRTAAASAPPPATTA